MIIFAPSLVMPRALVLAADHEAGDVLQEDQRRAVLVAQLDEMRALQRGVVEEHAVVGEDADLVAPDVGEAADQRRAVVGLVLVEAAAVDDAGDDLAHVELLLDVVGDDPVDLLRVVVRRSSGSRRSIRAFSGPRPLGRRSRGRCGSPPPRVAAGSRRCRTRCVCMSAPPSSSAVDVLAGRGLHQRRAAEEDRARAAHDDRVVERPGCRRRPPCNGRRPARAAGRPSSTGSTGCGRCGRP